MYKLLKDSLKIRRYLLVTILVIQFISVILSTLLPYMNGMFVDMLIDIKNVEEVIKYAITIAGVGIISLFLSYIYNLKIMKVKNNISFEINSRGILHLQKIPLEIEYEPTYMTQRLNSDSRIVVDFFFDKIITATINLFVMFFLISLLFYLSKPIFGVILISTIAAVVTASVALLLMNFSKSGKTVDESRAWLKRIIITWAILNGLGFIMAYITPFFAGGQWNG